MYIFNSVLTVKNHQKLRSQAIVFILKFKAFLRGSSDSCAKELFCFAHTSLVQVFSHIYLIHSWKLLPHESDADSEVQWIDVQIDLNGFKTIIWRNEQETAEDFAGGNNFLRSFSINDYLR